MTKEIRWDNRPEDFTHVNPRNMRSYKVIGNYANVWVNDQWNPSNVSVNSLVAKPTQEENKEMPVEVKVMKFDSMEEVLAHLQKEGVDISDLNLTVESEECDCPDCKLEAELLAERDAILARAKEIEALNQEGKVSKLEILKLTVELADESQKLIKRAYEADVNLSQGLEEDTEEEEENQEEDRNDQLTNIAQEVIEVLAELGINPKGDARKGLIASTALNLKALDKLGYLNV